MKGETRTSEFAKINPLKAVPAIDDDGFTLGESEAIVRYLMNSRKVGEEFYPSDPKIRAQVDRYFPFHHNTARIAFLKNFMAAYKDLFPPKMLVPGFENYKEEVQNCLKQFDELYLKDQKYIAGDQLTIADIFAVLELKLEEDHLGCDLKAYPKIKAYVDRCLENKVLKEVNEMGNGLPKLIEELREELKLNGPWW